MKEGTSGTDLVNKLWALDFASQSEDITQNGDKPPIWLFAHRLGDKGAGRCAT